MRCVIPARHGLPERIRRFIKRAGAGAAGVSILLWLTPFSRGWSGELLAVALIGIAAAWSAASGGRFDSGSGGDAGSDWFDVSGSEDGGGDGGDGGD